MNGACNYSWTRWHAGTSYTPAKVWHDLKASVTEAYRSQSSLEVSYQHLNGGYIDLYLSSHPSGQSIEPTSVFDTPGLRFDEVKAIQFYVDDQLPSGDVHYKVFGLHFSRYN